MHGGALELAEQARRLWDVGERPDLILATSMTNLPAFLALAPRASWRRPLRALHARKPAHLSPAARHASAT